MANFTIRVDLHGAQADDYSTLTQKLAQFGVGNIVNADNGSMWALPQAEYVYTGNETQNQVLNAVKGVANSIVPSNAVIVAKIESICWDGLMPVEIKKQA